MSANLLIKNKIQLAMQSKLADVFATKAAQHGLTKYRKGMCMKPMEGQFCLELTKDTSEQDKVDEVIKEHDAT